MLNIEKIGVGVVRADSGEFGRGRVLRRRAAVALSTVYKSTKAKIGKKRLGRGKKGKMRMLDQEGIRVELGITEKCVPLLVS